MDQARIAELRLHEKYLRASGQMVGACLGECLDAIEAAQGHPRHQGEGGGDSRHPGPRAMTAYIAALRAAYDTLLSHMAAEGGVPMTDELARAIEVVEAHDAGGGWCEARLEARRRAGVHVP